MKVRTHVTQPFRFDSKLAVLLLPCPKRLAAKRASSLIDMNVSARSGYSDRATRRGPAIFHRLTYQYSSLDFRSLPSSCNRQSMPLIVS